MKTKKLISALLVLCVIAFAFVGCGSHEKDNDSEYIVDSAAVISQNLGLDIVLPEDASNETYYIIDTIAKISFNLGDNVFELRAQNVADVDASGIDESDKTLKDTFDLVIGSEYNAISFYSVRFGGLLAEWCLGGVSYSLYQSEASDSDDSYFDFADTANEIATLNAPASAVIDEDNSESDTEDSQDDYTSDTDSTDSAYGDSTNGTYTDTTSDDGSYYSNYQ